MLYEVICISILTILVFTILNFQEFKNYFFGEDSDTYTNFLNAYYTASPKPKPVEKSAGVGSIWNNNNWFFEEKNYTKFAKEYLSKKLLEIEHVSY